MGKSCLLVMDVQSGIVDHIKDKDNYLQSLTSAIKHAEAQDIMVIYIIVGFRNGMPEINQDNKSFSTLKSENRPGIVNPNPAIKTTTDDIIVTKRRVSAFSGSDLEVILRSNHINHLILTGVATSGVVLSTLREAADKDYHISVISDLCRDSDPEVHKILIDKIFPRQAVVLSLDEWLKT